VRKVWRKVKGPSITVVRIVDLITSTFDPHPQPLSRSGRGEPEFLVPLLLLLNHRFGPIAPQTEAQIRSLSLTQLESLGEALLDFSQPEDLTEWLRTAGG
jgi:hypothetical protein